MYLQISYYLFKIYEPSTPLPVFVLLGIAPGVLVVVLQQHFNSFLSAFASIFLSYWSLLVIFIVAYRLSPFHPLARYPGPVLCKLSKGWIAYISGVHGTTHLYVQKLHQQYGDVVRIGQRCYCKHSCYFADVLFRNRTQRTLHKS